MPVTLWLKGVVGGFSSLFFPGRVAKSRPFSLSHPFANLFSRSKRGHTLSPLAGRGWIVPNAFVRKRMPDIISVSLTFFRLHFVISRKRFLAKLLIFITTCFERDEAFVSSDHRDRMYFKRFNLWK